MYYQFRILIDDETLKEHLQYREVEKHHDHLFATDRDIPVTDWITVPKVIGALSQTDYVPFGQIESKE